MKVGISQTASLRAFRVILLFLLLFWVSSLSTMYAQPFEKVRTLAGQFFQEPNCPVTVVQTRAELDLDAFDAPVDARVYVTYANISNLPVTAVNFRIRLSDSAGRELSTFRGAAAAALGPGQEHSEKWKHERINPASAAMQIRVLQVKFADGSMWESFKMKELNSPGTGSAPGNQGATSPDLPQEPESPRQQQLPY